MKHYPCVSVAAFWLSVCLLFSCSGKKTADNGKGRETVQAMTREQLVEAAKKEGRLLVYSTTSRVASAAENFEKRYGIKVETANLKDGELVKKVSLEVGGKVAGADMVLCQDGARVYGELINLGYLTNYVPPALADQIPPENQNPLVFQFVDKVFIFNSEHSDSSPVLNIWRLTDPEWKGRIQFKNPNQEGVNSNFLTMLTSDEWADKIAQAYQDYYGKEIVLTTENAGYEWMKGFFNNAVLGTSDSTIAENVGTKGQKEQLMGLFVLSKLRYAANKNLALMPIKEMVPFSGFYYPIYVQLTANAQNVNAAKLFIEYLMTEEGFAPWRSDIGSYSGNPHVPCNEDDEDIAFWGPRLVREDPQYTYENRAEVEEFVNNLIN